MTDIDYDSLEDALSGLGIHQPGAEYHGTLAGMIAAGIEPPVDLGIAADLSNGAAADAARTVLEQLRGDTANDFVDADMGFAPMLPDDTASLSDRVQSLALWCQGFLFGAASLPGFSIDALSGDAQEVVRDFGEIARAGSIEESESEETAYAELIEYVRVGAQMLFFELHEQAESKDRQESIH
ncbi:UPF0149 family protein [uncultured Abyssibacter sp.]|uniref:UPF0149 family protein n=1 Tax=uncultured Abyssibacter sp. TaxID=2320202 RepID=UPI0032B18A84|tara:strand:- start:32 stop:580 length:549 start_codon:yes stop_codon:yes gene_type:complete